MCCASRVHFNDGPWISCFGREASHCVTIGIHCGTRWNGQAVFRQDRHARTKHHDHRIEASVGCDIEATAVVVCSFGCGVDAECEGCHRHDAFQVQEISPGGFGPSHFSRLHAFRSCCEDHRIVRQKFKSRCAI